jgi:hypothetical protein
MVSNAISSIPVHENRYPPAPSAQNLSSIPSRDNISNLYPALRCFEQQTWLAQRRILRAFDDNCDLNSRCEIVAEAVLVKGDIVSLPENQNTHTRNAQRVSLAEQREAEVVKAAHRSNF